MATETDFHHQNPRSVSVSEMLDHGSISFGRFTAESLAWEKWSVFSHNRYQEELAKFNFPGIVAQKKAYFEEYYRKFRTAKALPAEQKESKGQITQGKAGNNTVRMKEEMKYIQRSSENEASVDSITTLGADTNEVSSSWSSNDATVESSSATKEDRSTKEISLSLTPGNRSLGISQHGQILDSYSAKHVVNQSITQGNAASSRSIEKRESRRKNDGTKPLARDKITCEAETRRATLSKSRILKAENRNNRDHVSSDRKHTETLAGSTIKSMSSSDGKSSQRKSNSNVKDSTDKFRRSVPHLKQSPQCTLKKLGSVDLQPKGTDNNRLKIPTPRNKANLKSIGSSQRSYDRETKKEEGENKISTTTRTVTKPSITTPSRNRENQNLVQKSTKLTDQAQAQRVESRNRTPTWR